MEDLEKRVHVQEGIELLFAHLHNMMDLCL